MKTLNIGDLFILDDGDEGMTYYCSEYKKYASTGYCYVLLALNPNDDAIYTKQLVYDEDVEKMLSSGRWKYFPIVK